MKCDIIYLMERFIKDFSKEYSQDDRDSLASTIKERRREARSAAESLLELQTELDTLSANIFKKVFNFKRISTLKEEALHQEEVVGSLEEEYEESRELIRVFYRQQEEKWKTLPFDKEEIRKYFNPEYLKGLTVDEYRRVWERFGGGMLTHVTRQGVRDHADMGIMGHHGGEGKMHHGFKEATKNHKLEYNMALRISKENRSQRIAEYFNFKAYDSKEEAISRINMFTLECQQNNAGSFVDFHGPHFAGDTVLDDFYGAETGNEIFFAFPSYMIASNFYHKNNPSHAVTDDRKYNDIWVYFKEDDEIDLNSGLVFIPEDAQVDPQTGSTYELNEKGEAKVDIEFKDSIRAIVTSTEFMDFAEEAIGILGKNRYSYTEYKNGSLKYAHDPHGEIKETIARFVAVEDGIKELFPHISEKELTLILNYHFIFGLHFKEGEMMDSYIESRMQDTRMQYVRAKNTVSSKEYWEKYFIDNPGTRPNKCIYYAGGNPARALEEWKGFKDSKRGNAASPGGIIDFEENRMFMDSFNTALPDSVLQDIREFREEAYDAAEEYFAGASTIVSKES